MSAVKSILMKINAWFGCRFKNRLVFFSAKKCGAFEGRDDGSVFITADSLEKYLELCHESCFEPENNAEQRFSQGSVFAAVLCGGAVCCSGWFSTGNREIPLTEIASSIFISEEINMLFDLKTQPEQRRKGYYTDLLKFILSVIPGSTAVIYASVSNAAGCNGIKKAGFTEAAAVGHLSKISVADIFYPAQNGKKKSVLFFSESLDGGGAECIMAQIVSSLDKSKYDIYVVSDTDGEFNTPIIKANSIHRCFASKNLSGNPVKKLYNMAVFWFSAHAPASIVYRIFVRGKYDVEIAFCEGYATKLIACSPNKKSKKLAWVHTDVIANPWTQSIYRSDDEERACYEKFDMIYCVSSTVKTAFNEKFGLNEKTEVLYNPIDKDRIISKGSEDAGLEKFDGMKFISVGRIISVKGYDRLTRIAKRLHDDGYRFRIYIVGKGSELNELKRVIAENDADSYVILTGFQKNPYKFMTSTDVFVCSSLAEGFSTVATESLLLSLPIVTTDCSGMTELFGGKECGIICDNNEDALYFAMKRVLDEPELLEKFRACERERAADFNLNERIASIERLLDEP